MSVMLLRHSEKAYMYVRNPKNRARIEQILGPQSTSETLEGTGHLVGRLSKYLAEIIVDERSRFQ